MQPQHQDARKTSSHAAAYKIAGNYVQNHLPIYLIYIPDMKLLHRGDLMPHLKLFIDEMSTGNIHKAESEEWHALATSRIMAETEYAILSHRWLDEGELSFRDVGKLAEISMAGFRAACSATQPAQAQFNSATSFLTLAKNLSTDISPDMPNNGAELLEALAALCSRLFGHWKTRFGGLSKLVEFCVIAAQRNCKYVWMDTCCIDKSRSAELEESIRSMFRWYRNAKTCVVHLADTHTSTYYMRSDAWFTRGWTLQELLAPKSIKFFDRDWHPLTRNSNDKAASADTDTLWRTISDITNIDVGQLRSFAPGMHNIREIMVWAAKRETTRIEDVAYSLIGMLDVPLSIAYGEGPMAFYRLQVEIVQRSRDKGIFAWQGEPSRYNSMFAASPKCFSPAKFQNLPIGQANPDADHTHALTNYGMRMPLSLYTTVIISGGGQDAGSGRGEWKDHVLQGLGTVSVASGNVLTAYDSLTVAILGDGELDKSLALLLGHRSGQYKRIATRELLWVERLSEWAPAQTIYIN